MVLRTKTERNLIPGSCFPPPTRRRPRGEATGKWQKKPECRKVNALGGERGIIPDAPAGQANASDRLVPQKQVVGGTAWCTQCLLEAWIDYVRPMAIRAPQTCRGILSVKVTGSGSILGTLVWPSALKDAALQQSPVSNLGILMDQLRVHVETLLAPHSPQEGFGTQPLIDRRVPTDDSSGCTISAENVMLMLQLSTRTNGAMMHPLIRQPSSAECDHITLVCTSCAGPRILGGTGSRGAGSPQPRKKMGQGLLCKGSRS
ncbi:hypothetical protein QBC33DRAFT_597174 [Phialemonium atrogriseum]|uniref:Uncharacterized protein n=1 Tax=Phialemonium atrogriseum TaxID=1093897 RepID=A0AAJ0BXA2_9PEZI|nr:uncharacterized protein QBC33DRAFT_597174 [Phialemonium atrogriseum]KAK1763761.1 hypothetical protein QBC33DRAFT_597174 [Phialemonium atrogriseum]